jgi:hypothetical protein
MIGVITITGIGDQLRPEWPITFAGIRRQSATRVIRSGRACALIGIAPKTYRYASSRTKTVSCARDCVVLLANGGNLAIGALHILLRREASR